MTTSVKIGNNLIYNNRSRPYLQDESLIESSAESGLANDRERLERLVDCRTVAETLRLA